MTNNKNIHAVELGRLGGLAKSPRKAAAVRLNGLRGGRKRNDGSPTQTAERKAQEAQEAPARRAAKSRATKLAVTWEF